jgi:molecular chaperone GrpE (heat shock protein)
MKTHEAISEAKSTEVLKTESLEDEALEEARLRRDVATAEVSLDRVTEDLERFRTHHLDQGSNDDATVPVKDLLPIMDSLEAAIESGTDDVMELRQTMGRAFQNLLELLLQRGIETERTLDQPYNPRHHILHSMDSDPSKLENTVLKVIERGYHRGGEIFRPAKVIVNVLDQTSVGDGS